MSERELWNTRADVKKSLTTEKDVNENCFVDTEEELPTIDITKENILKKMASTLRLCLDDNYSGKDCESIAGHIVWRCLDPHVKYIEPKKCKCCGQQLQEDK